MTNFETIFKGLKSYCVGHDILLTTNSSDNGLEFRLEKGGYGMVYTVSHCRMMDAPPEYILEGIIRSWEEALKGTKKDGQI